MLDNTGKNRSNNFFHWKGCPFFSKMCVFDNLLGPEKNGPINYTTRVRKSCGLFLYVPWGLLHSILREKKAQNISLSGKIDFFQKLVFSRIF